MQDEIVNKVANSVLEVFDLPAPHQPFDTEIQGQLSGDAFTNSGTRQEPVTVSDERQVSSMPNGCQLH